MFDNNLRNITLAIVLFLMSSCAKENAFQKIRDGDFDVIEKGRYRGTTVFLRDGAQYKKLVDQFRAEIEKNRDVFSMITREFFFVPQRLIYRFKFAALDNREDYLILRYFARIVDDPVLAGYQIQFIFEIGSKRLIEIYTDEVPLE